MFADDPKGIRVRGSVIAIAILLALSVGGAGGYLAAGKHESPATQVTLSEPHVGQAVLPKKMQEHVLVDMKVGEKAYTTAWAMWIDESRHAWLNGDYPAEPESEGTVNMLVQRIPGGYVVNPPSDEKYLPEDDPHFVGGVDNALKVVSIQ
jgi:hypothetical protein